MKKNPEALMGIADQSIAANTPSAMTENKMI